MKKNCIKKVTYLFFILFLVVIIMIAFLVIKNFTLKNELSIYQNSSYKHKITELVKAASNQIHYNDTTIIVKTEKFGLWDKDKKRKKKLKLIPELSIGDFEGDLHKTFYRIGPVLSDEFGNIYICEFFDGYIKKFNKNGDYLLTIGRKGQGPGELAMPMDMKFDNNGNLNILELGNRRISVFSPNGKYLSSIKIVTKIGSAKFIIDTFNNIYISSWDEESDKIIHKYSSEGRLLCSFGDPVNFLKPLRENDRIIKKHISGGPICWNKGFVYYSRYNPYEIQKFSEDGDLKMQIFRQNNFMPPAKVKLEGNNSVSFRLPVASIFLTSWKDRIINQVKVPNYFSTKIHSIIDLFDLNGTLLTTLMLEDELSLWHLDNNDRIYGVITDKNGIEKVVRFHIKLD